MFHNVQKNKRKKEETSSDQTPHEGRSAKRPVVLVWHRSVDVALKEGEHGEPDARSATLLVHTGVGQRVVVEEEARGDVEGDEHVDGVMLVGRQDEEDSKQV